MFKGFTAAQSRYDNMLPDDDECDYCVAGCCEFHDVYAIENRLEDLGYKFEVISCGITILNGGKIKFHGTEEEVMEWLEENGEA